MSALAASLGAGPGAAPGLGREQGGRPSPERAGPEAPPVLPGGARELHDEREAAELSEAARRLRERAEALRARRSVGERALRDALGELSELDRRRSAARVEVEAARLEVDAARLRREAASARARSLERRLAESRRRMARVIEALARAGARPAWRRLVEALSGAPQGSGQGRLQASAAVRRHADLARDLEATAAAAARAAALERRRESDLAARRGELESRLEELEAVRRARSRRLARLRLDQRRLASELVAAEAELEELLAGSGAPERAAPSPPPAPGAEERLADPTRRKGSLPWPVEAGARVGILHRFGTVRDRRHGTRTPHQGLTLDVPAGTPIRAVAAGRVVFRDWFKGFGLTLVVDHGHGLLSVCAHAEELAVEVGQLVAAGQLVGRSGDTGTLEGPRLYFRLQHDGRAVDPLEWLEE